MVVLNRLRPLSHVLFTVPQGPVWVLDQPGHRQHGDPVPQELVGEIQQTGTLDLPSGTFRVHNQNDKWVLDAPGFKEHGHPVPQKYVGGIVSIHHSLLLKAGRFTVVQKPASKRRVFFNANSEEFRISCEGDESWVFAFDTPFCDRGTPVAEDFVDQIVCDGTVPRISTPSGSFNVIQLPESEGGHWVLDEPGREENRQLVPVKFIHGIKQNARKGTLSLAGGDFAVVERPPAVFKTCGPRLPMKRTSSETVLGHHQPSLRRVHSSPTGVSG
eukprot:gnl/TRDRNA2_/TRDRNA2_93289_c0_seq1.p1 gnl/TRDRNA2_/TRDRNA2_93289_c0~~gnl/TRDRNA2_/TRDRNA2_93289_c0_seq1.p1  ORF type:complete len:285 (-),score=38.58 gnl/TRDRNA2_/TRDRNA2_93289_c0_seq1:234-1049(-)